MAWKRSAVSNSSIPIMCALPHHADLNVADPHRRRAVPHVRRLRWLALATVRRAPHLPLLAHGVHAAPEARRDPGVGAILEHRAELAVLDLPADFGAELEVEALVV